MAKHNEIKQPFKSQEELENALREISSKEQVYSIALFDILGFSNFVETNGNQIILELYNKLLELINKQKSSFDKSESFAGKLHDNKYLKEMIENEFKIRKQLTKELLDGRINQEELFEFGRTRTTDLSSGDMLHTEETEVNRDTTDEGYGGISAEAARIDIRTGNERYDSREPSRPDESTTAEAGRYDKLYTEEKYGDTDGCGECFETGWETEREFYFRVLLGDENQLRSIGRSDRYAENTSVEVPGDYDRSSNLILDAGVGTLTAVASLMDNDQDDDPEEKKKKLDAKDAGSNFGFALGSAIGLATALLSKSKRQDEDITEIPTEEPDKAEEIDNNTYEDGEDLDEDEGFSLQM